MIPCLVPDLPSTEELRPWLERIDANRWYTNFGPLLKQFEGELQQRLPGERTHARLVTAASGAAALELALAALGLPAGARVLLPAFTFPATATAVLRSGLTPLLTDVDRQGWLLTPDAAAEAARHARFDLVIPVATFGRPLPAADWDRFAADTGIPVLIDAAAAFGEQAAGRLAHAVFSFHATKPFGIGEGGAVVSSNADLVDRCRCLSNFGFEGGVVAVPGGNAKLSEYHAAVGLAQLARWPELRRRREQLWRRYAEALAPLGELVEPQAEITGPPPAVLCVAAPRHAAAFLAARLGEAGIETRRWYLPPLHHHPLFAGAPRINREGGTALPVCEELSRTALGLPFHTRMEDGQAAFVCASLASALRDA